MISASEAKTNALNAQEVMRLEKIQREIEKKARFAQVTANTIKFCNAELSAMISDASLKGDNYLELHWGFDNWNEFKSIYCPLIEEEDKYANGDSSFKLNKKHIIHLPTMIEYLIANNYSVEKFDWTYKHYGSGSQSGMQIRIQWNP